MSRAHTGAVLAAASGPVALNAKNESISCPVFRLHKREAGHCSTEGYYLVVYRLDKWRMDASRLVRGQDSSLEMRA